MQTGGTNDPDAPHKVQFEGSELKFCDHNDITLLNMPNLKMEADTQFISQVEIVRETLRIQ